MRSRVSGWRFWAAAAGLVLLIGTVFGQTARFDFVMYDDGPYVTDNEVVRTGFTWEGVRLAFTQGHAGNWHPITWLTHMLDCELFGLDPGPHHLINAAYHALAAVLLLRFLTMHTGAFWPGLFAAALFAIHPLRAESVAWISERKDVLCGVFWMLTLLAYGRYVHGPSPWRYGVVMLGFAAAFMAKPMAVTLPVVLLALDYWPFHRFELGADSLWSRLRWLVWEKAPLLALACAGAVVTVLVQGAAGAVQPLGNLPLTLRLENALVAPVKYLGVFFWPFDLAVYYPLPREGYPWWQPVGAALLLLALTAGMLEMGRRFPYLPAGWFWYLIALLPVIGIVQVGDQAMADRYTYLPQIGLAVALSWGVAHIAKERRWLQVGAAVAGCMLIAGLSVRAHAQTTTWRNSFTLFAHAVDTVPDSYLARINLGSLYVKRGNPAAALEQFRAAVELEPELSRGHYNLGVAWLELGRPEDAVASLRTALQLDPHRLDARTSLGTAYLQLGCVEAARRAFEAVLEQNPDFVEARSNLAAALLMERSFEEAESWLKPLTETGQADAVDWNNLGLAVAAQGRLGEARDCFERALELDPSYAQARLNLERLPGAPE